MEKLVGKVALNYIPFWIESVIFFLFLLHFARKKAAVWFSAWH